MAGAGTIVRELNSVSEFETALSSSSFVVVDFNADWCPPCKVMTPLFNKLAAASAIPGHLAFVSINVDEVPEVAQEYSVTSMPSFLFFADGKLASIDTNGTVKGGGAVLENGRVKMIRGADPRALHSVVSALARVAKAKAAAAAAPAKTVEETTNGDDGKTVSGSYTMGTEGGKRSDWKMSLNP